MTKDRVLTCADRRSRALCRNSALRASWDDSSGLLLVLPSSSMFRLIAGLDDDVGESGDSMGVVWGGGLCDSASIMSGKSLSRLDLMNLGYS